MKEATPNIFWEKINDIIINNKGKIRPTNINFSDFLEIIHFLKSKNEFELVFNKFVNLTSLLQD